jgi:RimJ/RimL family protein N-acetyltransferase
MDFFVETERLILRQFNVDDAEFIYKLLNSPGWLKYIGDRNVKSVDDAEAYLSNGPIKSYQTNGYGLSMVSLKEDGTCIGACGLLKRDFLDHPDIGFAFLSEYMNMGFGFESAKATLDYAKKDLKINQVFAFTVPHNIASIRLLEKLGFHFEKKFTMPEEVEELLLFNNEMIIKDS